MPGSWPSHELPNLTIQTCQVTSAASRRYNCIAWASKDTTRWWWPDAQGLYYWPPGVPREETLPAFMLAYEKQGYKLCFNDSLQAGVEKIAIFGHKQLDGIAVPTHAALQLESGEWSSKLGIFEDVRHKSLDDANGPAYGKMICCMSRPRPAPKVE